MESLKQQLRKLKKSLGVATRDAKVRAAVNGVDGGGSSCSPHASPVQSAKQDANMARQPQHFLVGPASKALRAFPRSLTRACVRPPQIESVHDHVAQIKTLKRQNEHLRRALKKAESAAKEEAELRKMIQADLSQVLSERQKLASLRANVEQAMSASTSPRANTSPHQQPSGAVTKDQVAKLVAERLEQLRAQHPVPSPTPSPADDGSGSPPAADSAEPKAASPASGNECVVWCAVAMYRGRCELTDCVFVALSVSVSVSVCVNQQVATTPDTSVSHERRQHG